MKIAFKNIEYLFKNATDKGLAKIGVKPSRPVSSATTHDGKDPIFKWLIREKV